MRYWIGNAWLWTWALVAQFGLQGCANETPQVGDAPETIDQTDQAIFHGTSSGVNFGIVQIAWNGNETRPCTGYFISKRHIVTSAHCTDRNFVSQWYKVYTKTGNGSFAFLKDTQRADNWVLMRQTLFPGFDFNNQQARFDTAILTLPATATGNVPTDLMRVSTAAAVPGQIQNTWGWGAFDIGPRGMLLPNDLLFGDNVTVSTAPVGSYTATSTGSRLPCVGDSGAPGTRFISGVYVANGTHRGAEDPRCAVPGEKMFWSDTSDKVSWIETTLRATFGSAFSCARFSSGSYMKCF